MTSRLDIIATVEGLETLATLLAEAEASVEHLETLVEQAAALRGLLDKEAVAASISLSATVRALAGHFAALEERLEQKEARIATLTAALNYTVERKS
jgi:hypothetical protein